MKRRISLLIALVMILTFSTISYGDIVKDETVYVNLNYDGSVSNISVVNRISGTSDEEYFVDYGKYEYVKNLSGDELPVIDGDMIKWPTSLIKDKDIYYEGGINKDLPVKLNIAYFLNGSEVNGRELAGKEGELKIQISVGENDEGLTTQIQLSLDLDLFSNIQVKNGTTSVVGKKMNIVFTHLPLNDEVYEFSAYGKDIELDSIIISSMPASISLPEDINENLDKFASGMDEMSEAADKLEDGAEKLTDGTVKFKNGFISLKNGISKLAAGLKEISLKFAEVIKGFDEFNQGLLKFKEESNKLSQGISKLSNGFKAISNENENLKKGIGNLNNGIVQVNEGVKGLDSGLENLSSNHQKMVPLAKELAKDSDPRVKALAEGVLKEAGALEELSSGASQTSDALTSLAKGSNELNAGFEKYVEGQSSLLDGMNNINQGLNSLPGEIDKMYEGHSQLVKGLKGLSGGIDNLNRGLQDTNNNISNIPNELDKLIDGEKEIKNGISKLNEEGIKKAKKSISSFEGLSELNDNEDIYTSFVDNERNKLSTSQFIMKTPEIKVKVEKTKTVETPNVKENFLQRILKLFKK